MNNSLVLQMETGWNCNLQGSFLSKSFLYKFCSAFCLCSFLRQKQQRPPSLHKTSSRVTFPRFARSNFCQLSSQAFWRKRDWDLFFLQVRHFDTKNDLSLKNGDCSTRKHKMEGKNIKASDLNHISNERNFFFLTKERKYVSTSSCFGLIISKFFVHMFHPLEKELP